MVVKIDQDRFCSWRENSLVVVGHFSEEGANS